MAALTWAEVVAMDAGLSILGVPAQDLILAHVNEALRSDVLGTYRYAHARVLLAAHYGRSAVDMATAAAAGVSGPVVSESVGGISATYASVAIAAGAISSTWWGSAYSDIINHSGARAGVTI